MNLLVHLPHAGNRPATAAAVDCLLSPTAAALFIGANNDVPVESSLSLLLLLSVGVTYHVKHTKEVGGHKDVDDVDLLDGEEARHDSLLAAAATLE